MYKEESKLKEEAPAELGFSDASAWYTAATSKRVAIRLSIAWGTAKAIYDARVTALTAYGNEQIKMIVSKPVRGSMELLWATDHNNNIKQALDKQGSDTLLGILIKELPQENVPVL